MEAAYILLNLGQVSKLPPRGYPGVGGTQSRAPVPFGPHL
jgi:hypothetical protein